LYAGLIMIGIYFDGSKIFELLRVKSESDMPMYL